MGSSDNLRLVPTAHKMLMNREDFQVSATKAACSIDLHVHSKNL